MFYKYKTSTLLHHFYLCESEQSVVENFGAEIFNLRFWKSNAIKNRDTRKKGRSQFNGDGL